MKNKKIENQLKRERYKPQPYEALEADGTGKQLHYMGADGEFYSDRYARLYKSLLISNAYKSLSPRQKLLYICMVANKFNTGRPPKEVYREDGLFQSDEYFFFPFNSVVKDFELYPQTSKSNFHKDIKALEKAGLIEMVYHGKLKRMSVYKFSDEWKKIK